MTKTGTPPEVNNPKPETSGTMDTERNAPSEVARTGQCGAGTDKSRMTSGRIRRRKSRMTSDENNKKDEFGTVFDTDLSVDREIDISKK